MAKKDYYDILGVNKNATEAEIKSAFRKKAKEYHPDVNKDPGASDKFKEIGEAYSILSDSSKRSQYDQFGSAAFDNNSGGFGGFSGGFSGFDFEDLDLGSIFEQFMGGGFGSSRSRSSKRKTKGEDFLIKIDLTFEEAVFGTEKTFELNIDDLCDDCNGLGGHNPKTCPKCSGRGRVITEQRTILGVMQTETTCPYCKGEGTTYETTCSTCRGKKTTKKKKKINLRVPSGIDNGDQMRMNQKGSSGLNGGPNGDIYIDFTMKKHPLFKRDGKDIYLEVPLTITEAALGVTKDIPTLTGKYKHTFSSGTQNGDEIKLRGKGIDSEKERSTGDMYLITKVIIPSKLDRKQKSLLKDLDNTKLENDIIFKNFNKYL
ncbi:MAG: molecular chaperone DnaJ [Bacilli bacterium]|nr:molecular chaperone DnaJ [Bacilli bacterium]